MDLELPDEFVPPRYDGGSIANVPATIAALLQAPFTGRPPLSRDHWEPLHAGTRRVVVIVLDAFGANLLERHRRLLQPWLDRARVKGDLTSVFPSTTVAALSAIWTGLGPSGHGLTGLNMLFPDFGAIGQMLDLSPTFRRFPDALIHAGIRPETFLNGPGVAEQLALAGVATHAFKGAHIVNSALSKMHGRGVAGNHGVFAFPEMMVLIRQLLESSTGDRLYVNAYWPTVDTLSHYHLPFSEPVEAEIANLFDQIGRHLWRQLSRTARDGTALIVMADHGQRPTPRAQWVPLEAHPDLERLLLMRPAGEARAAYLYARQGCVQDILAYARDRLPDQAVAFRSQEALDAGLFGPLPVVQDMARLFGDVVLAMRDGFSFVFPLDRHFESRFVSRHGGMTAPEMMVPWLAFDLSEEPPPPLDSTQYIR